jgi:hypothetical protein
VTRPVVGVLVAVRQARFGLWDQDVAMVPTTLVTAVQELGWLALLLTADEALAADPEQTVALVDGLIVPDWAEHGDRYADFSRRLGETAEARGLPVLILPVSLHTPDTAVSDYVRAIAGRFTPEARAASV